MPNQVVLPHAGLIAATFTPLQPDGSVNLDGIVPLVDHLVRDGVAGLFVCGTTGEGASLTVRERQDVAAGFIKAAAGRLPVIVHVGHNCLQDAAELAAHAAREGAAAIAAHPPTYYPPANEEEALDCVERITSIVPQLPFYYYHIPNMSNAWIDLVEFLDLAQWRLPNLAGIKYSAPTLSELQDCLEFANRRYQVLFGVDEMLLGALAIGVTGAVGSTYNFAAPLYKRLIDAFAKKRLDEARELQSRSVAMCRTVLSFGGLPGLKAVMGMIGVDCGPPRLPLPRLRDHDLKELRGELDEIGFFDWRGTP